MSADYNEEAYENALIELFQNMGGVGACLWAGS